MGGYRGRSQGIHGNRPTTKHVPLRGIDVDNGQFFTLDGEMDFRDDVTGRKLETARTTWNFGRMVDSRLSKGGRDKYPQSLAYAFLGLATYDTEELGVQQRPAGSDPS